MLLLSGCVWMRLDIRDESPFSEVQSTGFADGRSALLCTRESGDEFRDGAGVDGFSG